MGFSNEQKDGSGDSHWLVSDTDGHLKVVNAGLQAGTLLSSVARTGTTQSTDQTNPGARGVVVVLDVTAAATTAAITGKIQMKDLASGKYIDVLTATTAATTTGTKSYLVYPAADVTGSGLDQAAKVPLSKTWRVQVVHADASSKTYTVGYSYLP